MNPVLILTRNNLDLTKKCVESVRGQDIPTYLFIWDNDSTDGTTEWLRNTQIDCHVSFNNQGVSKGWNWSLDYLFRCRNVEYVLCINNDTLLSPWFYRHLLS